MAWLTPSPATIDDDDSRKLVSYLRGKGVVSTIPEANSVLATLHDTHKSWYDKDLVETWADWWGVPKTRRFASRSARVRVYRFLK